MKMLDRERRKKKKELESGQKTDKSISSSNGTSKTSWVNPETDTNIKNEKSNKIQTEIRTDEFVVRLLLFNFLSFNYFHCQKKKNIQTKQNQDCAKLICAINKRSISFYNNIKNPNYSLCVCVFTCVCVFFCTLCDKIGT